MQHTGPRPMSCMWAPPLLHAKCSPQSLLSAARSPSEQRDSARATLLSAHAHKSWFVGFLRFGGTKLTHIYTRYSLAGMNPTHSPPNQKHSKMGSTHSNLTIRKSGKHLIRFLNRENVFKLLKTSKKI